MTSSNPNPAWPLRSEGENAEQGCLPPVCHVELTRPSIRERAFDAAQRLILSQPHMAVGRLEQSRLADYVIEMAERFETWMRAALPPDLRVAGDVAFAEAADCQDQQGDIASDNGVIALTEKLIAEQRQLAQRMMIAEGKIDNLLRRTARPERPHR